MEKREDTDASCELEDSLSLGMGYCCPVGYKEHLDPSSEILQKTQCVQNIIDGSGGYVESFHHLL